MSDFKTELDALIAKKAAAKEEARRVADEASARLQKYIDETNSVIDRAFTGPLTTLESKAQDLGLAIKVEKETYRAGITIRAERLEGTTQAATLTLVSRGEAEGLELIASGNAVSSMKNEVVQVSQVTEGWVERALLTFTQAVLGV